MVVGGVARVGVAAQQRLVGAAVLRRAPAVDIDRAAAAAVAEAVDLGRVGGVVGAERAVEHRQARAQAVDRAAVVGLVAAKGAALDLGGAAAADKERAAAVAGLAVPGRAVVPKHRVDRREAVPEADLDRAALAGREAVGERQVLHCEAQVVGGPEDPPRALPAERDHAAAVDRGRLC